MKYTMEILTVKASPHAATVPIAVCNDQEINAICIEPELKFQDGSYDLSCMNNRQVRSYLCAEYGCVNIQQPLVQLVEAQDTAVFATLHTTCLGGCLGHLPPPGPLRGCQLSCLLKLKQRSSGEESTNFHDISKATNKQTVAHPPQILILTILQLCGLPQSISK